MSNSIINMESEHTAEETSIINKLNFVLKSEKKDNHIFEERERLNFLKGLKHFHDTRGTPYLTFPKIGGKDIDLFKLYNVVTNRGGWIKVNNRNEWDKVLLEFDLPLKCVNASVAIKHIYIRYLDRYEKLHYHKDDGERDDADDEESRHKRWSARSLHSVPMTYNNNQHNVSDALRTTHKLSTNLYKSSEYEKLLMSLLSPLPNEQDFAINVCTLMANESKHTLKVEKCPKLIDTLLAHSGIYNHYSTREIFIEFYSKIRRHSLQSFWNDCLIDRPEILELSYDDYFPVDDKAPKNKNDISKQASYIKEFYTNKDKSSKFREHIYSNLDFLCLGRGLGTHDYIGQRVHQIASILRNLSFIDENLIILARNRTYVRFLVLCSNIRWGNLKHMGLDMLGNISPELVLSDPDTDDLSRCLLTTISEGLECSDRAVIISCLEILYKLCQKENNEEYLHKSFNKNLYSQVCMFLSLSDIMLLLYTLECIYALSSLGEKSCNEIVQVRGAIDSLVSLVTVEAQSYGPDACILMRVVETVPGNVVNTSQAQPTQNFTALNTVQSSVNTSESVTPITPTSIIQEAGNSAIVQPTNVRKSPISVRPSSALSPQTPANNMQNKEQSNVVQQNTVAAKHAQQQVVQENEQFALAWLRATFEPVITLTSRVEQQELYKLYITASTKLGRRGVVSPLHFPRCVRSVFGGTVGPNPIKIEQDNVENTSFYYEGIRVRPKPLAVVHKGTVVVPPQHTNQQSAEIKIKKQGETIPVVGKVNTQIQQQQPIQQQINNQNSSVLVAQLCSKNLLVNQQQQAPILQKVLTTSSPHVTSQTTNIQQQHNTFMQQQQQQGAPPLTVTQSQTNCNLGTTSSVIKCLLANKVTSTDGNTVAASSNLSTCLIAPNVNMHQVAQRQQLQKQKELAQQQNNQSCIKIGHKSIISTTPKMNDNKNHELDHHNASNWDPVPPLAPLSCTTNINRQQQLHQHQQQQQQQQFQQQQQQFQQQQHQVTIVAHKFDDDSNSTGNNSVTSSNVNTFDTENSITSFDELLIHNNTLSIIPDDEYNTALLSSTKPSHVVTANKMLADLLEKKSTDPPAIVFNNQTENPLKRKIELTSSDNSESSSEKRHQTNDEIDENTARPSAKAADLYAELAASMLEDEDEEIEDETKEIIAKTDSTIRQTSIQHSDQKFQIKQQSQQPQPQQQIHQQLPQQQQKHVEIQQQQLQQQQLQQPQMISVPVPMQRQIIMSPNNSSQMMFASGGSTGHITTQTTATIKTESGYQTVPVLLQHHTPNNTNIQLQKQISAGGQFQLQAAQNQTQYVLTTNQQGQTVVVAQQQPQQMHQTVLVTQTPQQQGTSAKTIIILQQQSPGQQQNTTGSIMGTVTNAGNPQKVIMTTQQGQQVVVTQVPRPMQHHMIMNHPTITTNSAIPIISQNVITTTVAQNINSNVQPPPTPQVPQMMPEKHVQITSSGIAANLKTEIQSQNHHQHPPSPPPPPPIPFQAPPPIPSQTPPPIPSQVPPIEVAPKIEQEVVDPNWLWVCDWRGCPRKKFRSANEVYIHACAVHCPDNLDSNAEIYCQWGIGPSLCDNLPRKRFSLMTHLFDRHCTIESFKSAVQRKAASGSNQSAQQTQPVTIIKQPTPNSSDCSASSSAALHAIKRHALDFVTSKELMDENEGPVTKSIRLTAALILRNLVNYSSSAKRSLRFYEPHLAGVALSNVESSRTIAQVLYEMNPL